MTHKLKSLQGQRDKTRQIINTYEEDIKKKNLELKEKRIELNEIMTAIKNIENNNDVVISEHAILRYLERVKGFNLEDIKNEMLDARTRESLKVEVFPYNVSFQEDFVVYLPCLNTLYYQSSLLVAPM